MAEHTELTTLDGLRRLSPAYDLICTRLPIPSDQDLALPICGMKSGLVKQSWLNFAEYSQIPERAAATLLRTGKSITVVLLTLRVRSVAAATSRGA